MKYTIKGVELETKTPHRFKGCLTIRDFYKQYLKDNPKGSDFYVDYKLYRDCWESYTGKTIEYILEGGDCVLPYRLGIISIVKRKINLNNLQVDWKATRELGQRVFHLNEHSRGYRYSIRWNKFRCIVPNKTAYRFLPTRTFSRLLAKYIKSNHDYVRY